MLGLTQGTAGNVWPQWVAFSTATSTNVATINTQIWNGWNLNGGTQAIGGNQIWQVWTGATAGTTIQITGNQVWNNWNGPCVQPLAAAPAFIHRETDAQREARVQYEMREAERRKVTEAQRAIAAEKARKLLLENLTEDQRRELVERQHFHLKTRQGRLFRVNVGNGRSHNVKEIRDGRIIRSYCAYPTGDIPEDDAILGQKLALEHDEGEFLRLAYSRDEQAAA